MNIRLLEISEPKFPYRFRTSQDAYNAVKDYGRADRECFLVLFLNNKNNMIDCEVLSVGAIDTAAVYPREVLRSAILHNATAVILAHNHPTGDCSPSQADRDITRQIMAACMTAEICVLDHMIVGRGTYLSMADLGEIESMTKIVTNVLKKLTRGVS